MIFIVVKFPVQPEHFEAFPQRAAAFTQATRAEAGNLFFEWSRSLEDEHTYVLVEGFADGAAEAHVGSDHFKQAVADLPAYLSATPVILSTTIEGTDGWGPMAEMQVS